MESKIFKIIILLVIPINAFCSSPKTKMNYLGRELDYFFQDYYRVPYSADEFLMWEKSRIDSLSISSIVYNYVKKKSIYFKNTNDIFEMDVFKNKKFIGHYKNEIYEIVNDLDNPLRLRLYKVKFYNNQGERLELKDSLITDLYYRIGNAIERKQQQYNNGHVIIKYTQENGISILCKEKITLDSNYAKIEEILYVFSKENNIDSIVIPIYFVW